MAIEDRQAIESLRSCQVRHAAGLLDELLPERHHRDELLGLFDHLVTLRKSERHFSPTTRYQDYFEAPDRLHWESQSTTSVASSMGQRLVRGDGRHLFFVVEPKFGTLGRAIHRSPWELCQWLSGDRCRFPKKKRFYSGRHLA